MASIINRSGEIFAPIWISPGLFEAILRQLKDLIISQAAFIYLS